MGGSEFETLVVLANVRVVSNGLGLICEHAGRRFTLPAHAMLPGTTINHPGDTGMLVVPGWFAEENDLGRKRNRT